MPTRSKPVRIFARDDAALDQLSRVLHRTRAELVHEALAEYISNHRDALARLYDETQQALASGDLERLAQVSVSAREAEVDAIMADMPGHSAAQKDRSDSGGAMMKIEE